MSDHPISTIVDSLDPAMLIVTTATEGERAGCLVGFHSQSSIDPERYSLWLSKANHTYRVALRSSHLAAHFLTADDDALAERFGTLTGDRTDKFDGLETATAIGGVPVIAGCPHVAVLERIALLDEGGDHVCIVTNVVHTRSPAPFRPLRLSQVGHLKPGHESDERPLPATERAVQTGRRERR